MRFAEIALLAMPLFVFVAWRIAAPTAGPPRVLVIIVAAAVVAMAGVLLVLWYEEAEPPGTAYIPARLEDGRVVPAHVEPIAPPRADAAAAAQSAPAAASASSGANRAARGSDAPSSGAPK